VELIVLGRSPPPGSLEPIRRHLEAGGTALRTMRDPEAAETIAGLTGAEGVTAEEAEVEDYALLERIDFDHPLFAPFDEPRFSDFTKIHFWAYRRLDLGGLAEKARVLARFDRGGPAWVEIPVGSGSLLVMTSSWAPADGQLALSSKFVPLMYAVLERAAGSADRRGRFHVGDPIPLASFGSEAGRIAGIHRPDGERVIIEPDQASFEQTDTPGLYALEPEDGDPRRVAVNLDPAESRTAPMPLDRLEQFGVELGPPEVTEAGAAKAEKADGLRQERDAELERRQKVWRWVLMAALVVLMAEIWLAGRLSRSEPSPDRGVRGDRGVRDE
jgi:hypothetical protein